MTPFCKGEATPQSGKVAASHLPGGDLTSHGPRRVEGGSSCHRSQAQHPQLMPSRTQDPTRSQPSPALDPPMAPYVAQSSSPNPNYKAFKTHKALHSLSSLHLCYSSVILPSSPTDFPPVPHTLQDLGTWGSACLEHPSSSPSSRSPPQRGLPCCVPLLPKLTRQLAPSEITLNVYLFIWHTVGLCPRLPAPGSQGPCLSLCPVTE